MFSFRFLEKLACAAMLKKVKLIKQRKPMYLLTKFSSKNLIDFSKIEWEDFVPAMKKTVELTRQRINHLKTLPPSFENTIINLDQSTKECEQVEHIFACLVDVNKEANLSEKIDEISEQMAVLSSTLNSDIVFDKELFNLISKVKESFAGNEEDHQYLNEIYKGFVANGVNLPQADQNRLRELDEEIEKIAIKFDSNLLEEPLSWEVLITDESELEGIPVKFVEEAKAAAVEKDKAGWTFPVNQVTVSSIIESADSARVRNEFAIRYRSRGKNDNEYDNTKLLEEILKLKQEQAQILGFANFSEMTLKDLMLKTPQTVLTFLNELESKIRPYVESDFLLLKEKAKQLGIHPTQSDEAYLERKIKEEKGDINFEELREYFPLPKVWSGLTVVLNTLFDINFEPLPPASTWHPSVQAFKVSTGEKCLGVLYLDLYNRESKQGGAWMNTFVDGCEQQEPIIIVACNFSAPTKEEPSLLSMEEVLTLFHEMGHAIHGFLGKSKYSALSGVNVVMDFVELPSQIMENFVLEDSVLELISGHYKTNEPISLTTIKKIKMINSLFKSTTLLAYLGQARVDVLLHMNNEFPLNLSQWEAEYDKYRSFSPLPGTGLLTSFSHIWSGGYSSAYYSYVWAELMDADCYESFKAHGVLSKNIGKIFKEEILEQGSLRDELDSFIKFKGREPSISAYLRKIGVPTPD